MADLKSSVRVVLDATPVKGCFGCGSIPDEGVPLYQCQSCGTDFNRDESADGNSARCPDCNKFAQRQENDACLDCQEPLEDGFSIETIEGETVLLPTGATPA